MRHLRPGFTLIEMMLALALGLLVVYSAAAAVRVAAQTVTITNRLALENALIRTGMSEAHRQLDFWTNLDDPDDAGRQRLRATGVAATGNLAARLQDSGLPAAVGLPFTRMSDIFPANKLPKPAGTAAPNSQVPRFPNELSPQVLTTSELAGKADWESDAGFDPTVAWAPHDPRTWYRGNCIEKDLGADRPLWFGRYGIFTNTDANPVFKDFTEVTPRPATYSGQVLHLWYGRQLLGFSRALGFYGMCDYLPSNFLYGTYSSFVNGRTSRGGLPNTFTPNNGHESFVGQGMINVATLGLYALTVTQSYGVTNPYVRTAVSDSALATEMYRYYDSDYSAAGGGGKAELQQFINLTIPLDDLMRNRPDHWPRVSVGVGHFVKSAKFVNIAKIRWESPLTGTLAELSFTSVGSTLRGARMQRKPGTGWSRWDNANGAASNDANLDTP